MPAVIVVFRRLPKPLSSRRPKFMVLTGRKHYGQIGGLADYLHLPQGVTMPKLKLSLAVICMFFSLACQAQTIRDAAEAVGAVVGSAIGSGAGTAAKGVGRAVNVGFGGNDADEKLKIESKVETGQVEQEASGKSITSLNVGGISGNTGKNVEIKSEVKTKDIKQKATDGSKSTINIGGIGRN